MSRYVIEWPDDLTPPAYNANTLEAARLPRMAQTLRDAKPLPDCGLVGCEISYGHLHRKRFRDSENAKLIGLDPEEWELLRAGLREAERNDDDSWRRLAAKVADQIENGPPPKLPRAGVQQKWEPPGASALVPRDELVAAIKEAAAEVDQRYTNLAIRASSPHDKSAYTVASLAVRDFAESLAGRLQPEKPEVKAETCSAGKHEEGVIYLCDLKPEDHEHVGGGYHRDPVRGYWRSL